MDENELTRLFPCALYRYRVNSPEDTGLTKDLVQVTPLMESIAYGFVDPVGSANPNGVNTALYDPFVQLSLNGAAGGEVLIGIYLADTLPVVRGSTYRYLLVRFNPETREPRDVIPISNALTVP